MARATRILIVGGGYVGMYTALRLQKKLRARRGRVTVVDPQPHMTYQPFLPEAAAGSHRAAARRGAAAEGAAHVPGAHRRGSRRSSHAEQEVTVEPADGHVTSSSATTCWWSRRARSPARCRFPGWPSRASRFKTIGEAIFLRNHVLSRLDAAATTIDPTLRRRLLTFMVVGGGYAGVEALAELEDMARYASRYYPTIEPRATSAGCSSRPPGRIMPEVSPKMGRYTVEQLLDADIEVNLDTRVKSMVGGHVELADGQEFDTDTIIWTAGVKPSPMLAETDLPRDERGRLDCHATLQVRRTCPRCSPPATAPPCRTCRKDDPEARTSPSAQHAVRQAKVLADNVVAHLRGGRSTDYKHSYAGSVASLGLYKGVAEIYGVKLRGIVAWFMHRTYHVSRMPTWNRADPDRVRLDRRAGPAAARSCRWGRSTSRRPSSSGSRRRSGRSAPETRALGWRRRPRSPIGRGKPLKRVRVWVRVPPGAPALLSTPARPAEVRTAVPPSRR